MNVGEYCKRGFVTISQTADVVEAAKLMREAHVGFLVVLNEGSVDRRPAGVLTDRDIVLQVVAREVDPGSVKVADIMALRPMIAAESDDLAEAVRGMRFAGIRRLPVVDAHGSLAGVIALDDAITAIASMLVDLSGSIGNEQRQEWRAQRSAG